MFQKIKRENQRRLQSRFTITFIQREHSLLVRIQCWLGNRIIFLLIKLNQPCNLKRILATLQYTATSAASLKKAKRHFCLAFRVLKHQVNSVTVIKTNFNCSLGKQNLFTRRIKLKMKELGKILKARTLIITPIIWRN